MSATYSIEADPGRHLIRITMTGFFTPADIAGFLEARRVAHAQLRCPPNHHVTINDLRRIKIQSQDVVIAFQQLLAAPDYRSRRLAFVVSPTLARTQLIRALAQRDARCFEDVARAEHWLFADDLASAA